MRLKPEFDRFLSNTDREWLASQTDPAIVLRTAYWPWLEAFCSQVCPNLPEWQAWEEARAAREEAREALLPFLLPMIEAE